MIITEGRKEDETVVGRMVSEARKLGAIIRTAVDSDWKITRVYIRSAPPEFWNFETKWMPVEEAEKRLGQLIARLKREAAILEAAKGVIQASRDQIIVAADPDFIGSRAARAVISDLRAAVEAFGQT